MEHRMCPWSSRSSSWLSPGHAAVALWASTKNLHTSTCQPALKLCDMLFVCK